MKGVGVFHDEALQEKHLGRQIDTVTEGWGGNRIHKWRGSRLHLQLTDGEKEERKKRKVQKD